MNRITLSFLLFLALACALFGQQHNDQGLESLSELSRQGRFHELVEAAKPLLAANNLTQPQQGKAWTFLAHAYQQQGNFPDAAPAYEKALAIQAGNGEDTQDYATTLSAFSSLYLDTGQPDVAHHMLFRSLRIYEARHDHAGLAMTWSNLATIAVDRSSKGEAHKCIARAIHESQSTTDLSEDYFASLSSTQARLSELDGDPAAAIAGYERALDLWQHAHGEQHPEVGWLNVLLGRAYLEAGDIAQANEKTRNGLNRIAATSSPESVKFLLAEVAYANVLEAMNQHAQASAVRNEANAKLNSISHNCAQCRISVAALR